MGDGLESVSGTARMPITRAIMLTMPSPQERRPPLPDFLRPPVVEVAVGVQFNAQPVLRSVEVAAYGRSGDPPTQSSKSTHRYHLPLRQSLVPFPTSRSSWARQRAVSGL